MRWRSGGLSRLLYSTLTSSSQGERGYQLLYCPLDCSGQSFIFAQTSWWSYITQQPIFSLGCIPLLRIWLCETGSFKTDGQGRCQRINRTHFLRTRLLWHPWLLSLCTYQTCSPRSSRLSKIRITALWNSSSLLLPCNHVLTWVWTRTGDKTWADQGDWGTWWRPLLWWMRETSAQRLVFLLLSVSLFLCLSPSLTIFSTDDVHWRGGNESCLGLEKGHCFITSDPIGHLFRNSMRGVAPVSNFLLDPIFAAVAPVGLLFLKCLPWYYQSTRDSPFFFLWQDCYTDMEKDYWSTGQAVYHQASERGGWNAMRGLWCVKVTKVITGAFCEL